MKTGRFLEKPSTIRSIGRRINSAHNGKTTPPPFLSFSFLRQIKQISENNSCRCTIALSLNIYSALFFQYRAMNHRTVAGTGFVAQASPRALKPSQFQVKRLPPRRCHAQDIETLIHNQLISLPPFQACQNPHSVQCRRLSMSEMLFHISRNIYLFGATRPQLRTDQALIDV